MSDTSELKAVFEHAIQAINTKNFEAWAALWDEGIVRFGPFSPFSTDGTDALGEEFQGLFGSHEMINLMPINPQYRLIGDTGIAWGHYTLMLKPKDGPVRIEHLRYTDILAKRDGEWRFCAIHMSRIPAGT